MPGKILEAKKPTSKNSKTTTLAQSIIAFGFVAKSAKISPSCAEHGMASAKSKVAMIFSRLVSKTRVTMVAMVSHPKPKIMGITALPLRPIFLNTRSKSKDSLGK